MNRVLYIITTLIVIFALIGGILFLRSRSHMQQSTNLSATALILTSPVFNNGEAIPKKYSCQGEDINPPLSINDVDVNAKSLVLIVDDPDAPNGVFDHWIKWNIPPETLVIEEGKEPEGVAGKGTAGNLTYKGPCPPSGTHRYRFKLYALDRMLDLDEGATKAEVEAVMARHIIQMAELVGTFSK